MGLFIDASPLEHALSETFFFRCFHFMCDSVLPTYIYLHALCVCVVPEEARKKYQIP